MKSTNTNSYAEKIQKIMDSFDRSVSTLKKEIVDLISKKHITQLKAHIRTIVEKRKN